MNRLAMFRRCIIFCISNQVFFTVGLTLPATSESTTTAFNCKDTRVGEHYSSLVSGTGREAASPGECRALCRADQEQEQEQEETESCTGWTWFSAGSDSRSLRCFTGEVTGSTVASVRAVSGAKNCKFSSSTSTHLLRDT